MLATYIGYERKILLKPYTYTKMYKRVLVELKCSLHFTNNVSCYVYMYI